MSRRCYEPTNAEFQNLQLVADGLTDKEIAEVRGVNIETVKTQLRNTYNKLEANNRAHAVAIALRNDDIS